MEDTAAVERTHRWAKLTLIFGVILPSISILVEATTHICAEVFFDPIPTLWHLLLVVFVDNVDNVNRALHPDTDLLFQFKNTFWSCRRTINTLSYTRVATLS